MPLPFMIDLSPWQRPQVSAMLVRFIVDFESDAGSIVDISPLRVWQSRQLAAFVPFWIAFAWKLLS
jgi:hypothetical protein